MALSGPYVVPDFHLPFESPKHEEAEQANADATAWALDRGLIRNSAEDFAGIGVGHLAARVCHAVPYRRLVLFAKWMAWSFVLDDQHDLLIRSGRLDAWPLVVDPISRYLADGATGRASRPRGNPLVEEFVELCDEILEGMPDGLRGRFRLHIPLMLRSLDQEAANREGARPPAVDDYVVMRRHSSQLPPMMDMAAAWLGVEVPRQVYDSAVFQDLMWSAVDVISWGNDVFSLYKEYSCGDNNNLALLLAQRNGWPLPEAVRDVQERIRARVEDFLAGAQRLPHELDRLGISDPSSREAASRCVKSYQDWMIGADLWQRYECTRYRDRRWASGLAGAYTHPELLVAA